MPAKHLPLEPVLPVRPTWKRIPRFAEGEGFRERSTR